MKVIDGYDLAGRRRDVGLSRAAIGDICPRNDQNIPFNHLHHHHWKIASRHSRSSRSDFGLQSIG